MKNVLLIFRLLLVIPLFWLTACLGDDDEPQPANRKEILTANPWHMKKLLGNGINVTNFPEVAQFKDAQVKFNDDGTYTLTSDTENRTGNWAFAEDETKLVLNPGTEEEVILEIVSVREGEVKLRSVQEVPTFGSVTFTLELEPTGVGQIVVPFS